MIPGLDGGFSFDFFTYIIARIWRLWSYGGGGEGGGCKILIGTLTVGCGASFSFRVKKY